MYPGGDDRASHSYQGKRTDRNRAMFAQPGTAYVYMTYGMYFCFNISSRGEGAAVLLRALEPTAGIEQMKQLRKASTKSKKTKEVKDKELCNGPSKLCQAFGINKANTNMMDMADGESEMWIEDHDGDEVDVVVSTRIGIAGAGEESANKPFRLYEKDNQCVSVIDKKTK